MNSNAKINDNVFVVSLKGVNSKSVIGTQCRVTAINADGTLAVDWRANKSLHGRALDPKVDHFFVPSHDWTLTDDDSFQFQRPVHGREHCYEMVECISLSLDYAVAHGIIDMRDYSEEERAEMLGMFGYDESIKDETTAEEIEKLLAECFFETEFMEYLDSPAFSLLSDAVMYLAEIVSK